MSDKNRIDIDKKKSRTNNKNNTTSQQKFNCRRAKSRKNDC